MKSPQFIYFDLGNVLLFFDHQRATRKIAELTGIAPEVVWQTIYASDLMARFEDGRVDTVAFHREFEEKTGGRIDWPALDHAVSDIFQPNYELWPVVTALQNAGYRLGILSNTCPSHWHYVTQRYRSLLGDPFSVFALSYELRSCKPDRTIFTGAAKLAGVEPHEIFYTDDIPGHIAGAQAAGYDAVPFTTVREYVRELSARGVRINY